MALLSTYQKFKISIHAPRVGGRHLIAPYVGKPIAISIHAPRVGGDCVSI